VRLVLVGPVYPYRGGIAHYTATLDRELRARGEQVLLVSFKRQYPQRLFPGRSDRDPSAKPLKAAEPHYWLDSLNPLTWMSTFWRIRRYRPEVVILQWWSTFWAPHWFVMGALIRSLVACRLVYICHNVLPHESRRGHALIGRAALIWGSRFVVHSEQQRDELLTLLPRADVVVRDMPAFDLFAQCSKPKSEARRQLGIEMRRPVILFFGIVRAYKGLQDLLCALPEVRARLEGVLLLVAGEFWESKASYLALIRELGIEDAVRIDDRYVPDGEVGLYFSAADLLVAPYRQVTGSAVVQAALGSGCPVVATDVGMLSSVIRHGENGLLAPPGDPHALVETILAFFAEGLSVVSEAETRERRQSRSWASLIEALTGVDVAER
jgi:glycosyltransferase involved in cell wall biosynthesis